LAAANQQTPFTQIDRRARILGLEVSSWALLAAGATLAVVVINVTIVRPAVWQLAQLRRQVAQLEANVQDLAGQRAEVEKTNTLLGQLAEQGRRRVEASRSLDEISELHARLNRQTGAVERSLRLIEKLVSLEQSLAGHAERVDDAAGVLSSIETLEDRLTGRRYDTVQSHRALDSLDQLRDRLVESHCLLPDAEKSLDAIDALNQRLTLEAGNNHAAEESLDALVAIRDRLDDEGVGIEFARDRVDKLIELKDRAIGQTGNVTTAIETLELMIDVEDQLAKIGESFGRMRHWITEIVAFEPTFNRAMRSLQPLVELGNLRHMSPTDLRQVIRTMNDRRESRQWTATDSDATAPQEASPAPVAETAEPDDVPPIVESARAN
jgi:DNA repair exonuclease SbcCD ATPase subunit